MSKKQFMQSLLVFCFCAITGAVLLLDQGRAAAMSNLFTSPLPFVDFYVYPEQPAANFGAYFESYSYDPADIGIEQWLWDFGDGHTSTDIYPTHTFATDGDYLVQHEVTTYDGRSSIVEKTIEVRSQDVAITRLARPGSAKAGQTKRIIVSVKSFNYPTNVQVELYKSAPDGYEYIGFLRQFVDTKRQATKFYFSYTFTDEDAEVGKVVFRAMAWPESGTDVFHQDNEFNSYAVKVKPGRRNGRNADGILEEELVESAALDDYSDYSTDTVSNVESLLVESGNGTVDGLIEEEQVAETAPAFQLFVPFVSQQ